jgi:hypothetical protein
MVIEVVLAQRLSLFLGQPVVSLALLLTALLLPAGLGSLWSGRLGGDRLGKGIALSSAGVAAMALCHAFLVPNLLSHLLGLTLGARMAVTALLLAPLGFALGIPFPLGIRLLKGVGMVDQIPWMWCVNGISAVAGSAAAVLLAIQWGFSAALVLAAVGYLGIAIGYKAPQPAFRSL